MTDVNEQDSPFDVDDFVDSLEDEAARFDVVDASERDLGVPVSTVRRRRGLLADDLQTGYRELLLVERDNVLIWTTPFELDATGAGVGPRRRGRRAWRVGRVDGGQVRKRVSVPVLQPNEYIGALRDTDKRLNGDCDEGLRFVKEVAPGEFKAVGDKVQQAFSGRTLVLVHGTFVGSASTLGEYAATLDGRKFLSDALKRYKGQVLVFDHPTLSVSPFLNALELSRALAGTTGELDVIAHSRGGVVVRWWLDVLGESVANAKVRVVLAGSPLRGTSLAAPNRIQPLLSVLSNVGAFAAKAAGIAAAAHPFSLASFALLKFVVRREKNRWGIPPIEGLGDRPGTDAAVAVIPGLQGQSAVENNFELNGLRSAAARPNVRYHAVSADFEPERMGWKLWKVISEFGDRSKDAAVDLIFPEANDLVVDTAHMTTLGTAGDIADVLAFEEQTKVYHTNYFRQPEVIDALRGWLKFD
jgi:hypothetical protein